MTIYVSDTPYQSQFFLWADTSEEAVMACYALGMTDPQRSPQHNAWECYLLTPDQFADACGLGVTLTDKWGPAMWCLRRDGNTKQLRLLEDARTAWLIAQRE